MHLRLKLAGWLRARVVLLAALALVCVQAGWTAALLARSYFRQDDFLILDRAAASGFGWKYLMWLGGARGGHLMPLGLAIAWLQARVSLYSWLLASVVIGVLAAAASLALLRTLTALFGRRPAILVPLAVYMFGPLSLAAVTWWSAALEVLPLQLAVFMAVGAHVKYLRAPDGARSRHAAAAAAWLALGMAAADQGALVPLLLLAVTAGYFVPGRWPQAARLALVRCRRAWLVYGAVLACYCAVFFAQLATSGISPAGPGLATRLYRFAGTLIGKAALPGALGGPWQWLTSGFAQASPPAALEYLSWLVAALVIGVSCVYRMRAWRAWAILLGWVIAADIAPAAIAGFGGLPVTSLGEQTGYLADATAVLALCIGLAFIPLSTAPAASPVTAAGPDAPASWVTAASPLAAAGPDAPAPRALPRPVRVVALLVFCAFLAGTVPSLQAFEAANPATATRSYVATARLAVATAPRGTVIVDGPTPAAILAPGFFPASEAGTAQVLGPVARAERWTPGLDGIVADPMTFDDLGQLVPVAVLGPDSAPAPRSRKTGPACWDVTGDGEIIPLDGSLYRWPWTARLSYSGPAGLLAVSFGGSATPVRLPAGRHVVYVPVLGSGGTLSVQFTGTTRRALCVTGATVGSLHPDPGGRAIPAAPASG